MSAWIRKVSPRIRDEIERLRAQVIALNDAVELERGMCAEWERLAHEHSAELIKAHARIEQLEGRAK